jgi:hypothetical protein
MVVRQNSTEFNTKPASFEQKIRQKQLWTRIGSFTKCTKLYKSVHPVCRENPTFPLLGDPY